MDLRKKINIIFFTSLIVVPFTVFGVIRWINNNYTSLPYYGSKEEKASDREENFIVPSFSFINQNNQHGYDQTKPPLLRGFPFLTNQIDAL